MAGPAVTVTSPADGQAVDTNPAITGTVTSLSESGILTASVDGGAAQPVTVDSQGNFTFTPSLATDGSADGTHTVVFSAGSPYTDVSRSFVLDTVAPAITITSPANDQTVSANPTIVGTVTDATSGVVSAVATVDGGQGQVLNLDSQGNFSFIPPVPTGGSADGLHQVVFTATDAAGNVAASVTFTYTLDSTPPTITFTSGPPDGASARPDPVYTGTATDASGVTSLTVSTNGGTAQTLPVDGQGNFSFDPHLATDGSADGFYAFTFVAQDTVGNQKTVVIHYALDNTAPVAMITSPANNQTFSSNFTINGSATDNIGTSIINVYVDGNFVTRLFPD